MRLFFALLICVFLPSSAWASPLKVAVLEFAHEGGPSDWAPLGKGFQEMLLVDLSKAEAIDVVERRAVREQRIALGVAVPVDAPGRALLGKESGATHLLSGSFSVENNTLTLSAELLAVASGEVLLTKSLQGEADAFFELEKDVVNAAIGSLDVALGARERAETSRLHTADFLAFQDFSQGLDHFDAERYEASLTALRKASERDTQFSLATLTLDQYTDLVDEIKGKAEAIAVFKAEQQRLESLSGAGEMFEVYRKLLEIIGREGPQHQRERLAALHTLAMAYEKPNTRDQLFHKASLQDEFAKKRASDELAKRYHKEAMLLWPKIPVQVSKKFYCGLPGLETFDKDFEKCVTKLWELGADYPENRRNYLLDNLDYPREHAARGQLTLMDEIRLYDRYIKMAEDFGAPDHHFKRHKEDLVKQYRWVLRFDDSTRILKEQAKASDNEYMLKGLASKVEENKEFVEALKGAKNARLAEEWLMLARAMGWSRGPAITQLKEHFSGPSISDEEGAALMTRARDWPSNGDRHYLLVGNVPTWCMQHCYWVGTGPRDDPRHTDSVRFYKAPGKEPGARTLIVMGGFPQSDFDASFKITWTPASDFVLQTGDKVESKTAPVELLFGLNDIKVPKLRDAETHDDSLARPTFGYGVGITPKAIMLIGTREVERQSYSSAVYADSGIAEKNLKKALGDGARVDVSVRGRTVYARVGDVTLEHKLKEAPNGFLGLRFSDTGYVQVSDLHVKTGK